MNEISINFHKSVAKINFYNCNKSLKFKSISKEAIQVSKN